VEVTQSLDKMQQNTPFSIIHCVIQGLSRSHLEQLLDSVHDAASETDTVVLVIVKFGLLG